VLEPFIGTGTISAALRAAGSARVSTNDLSSLRPADTHLDALQRQSYSDISSLTGAPVDAIVTSPWFTVLDVAVPVMVEAASVVTCVHVPGHYL
jgi:hypothetical protein